MFVDFPLKISFFKERNQVQFELQLHQPSEIPPTSLAETRASTANKRPGHHPPRLSHSSCRADNKSFSRKGWGHAGPDCAGRVDTEGRTSRDRTPASRHLEDVTLRGGQARDRTPASRHLEDVTLRGEQVRDITPASVTALNGGDRRQTEEVWW